MLDVRMAKMWMRPSGSCPAYFPERWFVPHSRVSEPPSPIAKVFPNDHIGPEDNTFPSSQLVSGRVSWSKANPSLSLEPKICRHGRPSCTIERYTRFWQSQWKEFNAKKEEKKKIPIEPRKSWYLCKCWSISGPVSAGASRSDVTGPLIHDIWRPSLRWSLWWCTKRTQFLRSLVNQ
jgi:hypothetical protein